MRNDVAIIAGSEAQDFAYRVCDELASKDANHTVQPINTLLDKFSNGESRVEILDSIRDKDVFVFQSTGKNSNDDIMELVLILDALKRAGCYRITTVLLNYPYARQDRKVKSRVPISSKLVADLLTMAGTDRVLTIELHSPQTAGFFNCPVDNLYSGPVFIDHIKSKHPDNNICIVAPDAGSVKRAKSYAKVLDCDVAMLYKHRDEANKVAEMHLIGEVEGKSCIIIDDMIDTAATLCKAAEIIKENGAKDMVAYATHAVLSGRAIENLNWSNIDHVYVTDTINNESILKCHKLEVISVAPLFADAIVGIHTGKSLSFLFNPEG